MRVSNLFSALISMTFLFSACNPRDNKVVKPGTTGTTVNGASLPDPKYENYKYVTVLAERQVEILEIYKALSDESFRLNRGMKTTADEIVTENINLSGVTRKMSLLSKLTYDRDGKLQKITLSQNNEHASSEKVVGSKTIEIQNDMKNIMIESNSNGSFDVTYVSLDRLMYGSAPESTMVERLKFNFTADATLEQFVIHSVEVHHLRGPLSGSNTDLKTSATEGLNLIIKIPSAEKCATIDGVLKLESIEMNKDRTAPAYTNVLSYTKSGVGVEAGKKFIFPALDCDIRPTVDLTKLL